MRILLAVWAGRSTALGYPALMSTAPTLRVRTTDYLLVVVVCLVALGCDVVGLLPGHRSYARRLSALILLVAWLPMELFDALSPYLSKGWTAFPAFFSSQAAESEKKREYEHTQQHPAAKSDCNSRAEVQVDWKGDSGDEDGDWDGADDIPLLFTHQQYHHDLKMAKKYGK